MDLVHKAVLVHGLNKEPNLQYEDVKREKLILRLSLKSVFLKHINTNDILPFTYLQGTYQYKRYTNQSRTHPVTNIKCVSKT